MLDVSKKKILLIGAGKAGLEKLRTFSQLDTTITVISKDFLSEFFEHSNLLCIQKVYEYGDMDNFDIVYSGINDKLESVKIKEEAKLKNKLINFIDKPDDSEFISASSLIFDHFTIFISTYGKAPGAAKKIRETLEDKISFNDLEDYVKNYIKEREKKLSEKHF
jgi:precorrin-2 dehydrogenase / sirohydrochlorin ferrochelatase